MRKAGKRNNDNKKTTEINVTKKNSVKDRESRKLNRKEKAKAVKKFPLLYKGFAYKPYIKGINLYIDVAKLDNMSKKTTYKVVGNELHLIFSSMPTSMHAEYMKVLNKNITGIIVNLKWYKLLWFRVTGLFRRKRKY